MLRALLVAMLALACAFTRRGVRRCGVRCGGNLRSTAGISSSSKGDKRVVLEQGKARLFQDGMYAH